jgi:SAM-dependent methyltransferase
LDGFIAHCLPFCEITMMDFRALPYKIPNLRFVQTNCMDMNNIPSNSISSLSSLHVVEHFGLGRYGDPVDPVAHIKAISEIQRVINPGGKIIFSVPVGVQRLEFNAQRIFNPKSIIELFSGCNLDEFSVVDDDNNFYEHQKPEDWAHLRNGWGLFLFTKRSN